MEKRKISVFLISCSLFPLQNIKFILHDYLYHLKYTGTLGVLVKAKKLGYLSSVASVITILRQQGMWLTDSIINDVLKLAGESKLD